MKKSVQTTARPGSDTFGDELRLQRWKRPSNYAGPEWSDFFIGPSQHRDSEALDRSNFKVAGVMLSDASKGRMVPRRYLSARLAKNCFHIVRDSHYAVGWVEYLLVHETDHAALQQLKDIQDSLADYPALDEDDWSELEQDEIEQAFENSGRQDLRRVLKQWLFKRVMDFHAPEDSPDLNEEAAQIIDSGLMVEPLRQLYLDNAERSQSSITDGARIWKFLADYQTDDDLEGRELLDNLNRLAEMLAPWQSFEDRRKRDIATYRQLTGRAPRLHPGE